MTTFQLARTGLSDLEFNGQELLNIPGDDPRGAAGGRWHNVALYKTDDGRFLVAVSYHSPHPTELSHYFVEAVQSVQEFDDLLSIYRPSQLVDRKLFDRQLRKYWNVSRVLTRR